ncbi:hypothetical protein OOK27_05275 [Streptomyces canus]|uniref:hypothetical protein n=1 Tax=Streptomyces canus TaxID=58343 RepID=UPI00225667E4|nr:hypothetical protein [Streptomyces canus]MCX5253584.1 hypothetical protein [Streptomyces canus]
MSENLQQTRRSTPTLTPEQARAAATGYGWSLFPHDNGGFHAQRGPHQMIVTFDEHRVFRTATVQEGRDGLSRMLTEDAVVGAFARFGAGPVRSDEGPAAPKETP